MRIYKGETIMWFLYLVLIVLLIALACIFPFMLIIYGIAVVLWFIYDLTWG